MTDAERELLFALATSSAARSFAIGQASVGQEIVELITQVLKEMKANESVTE